MKNQENCPHLRISASPTEPPYCADCGKKFVEGVPSEPLSDEIKIAVLEGEKELYHDEIGWWAKELDFWRAKYLREHPEHDNWEYVATARKKEEAAGFWNT
jgi:hypothetical protein